MHFFTLFLATWNCSDDWFAGAVVYLAPMSANVCHGIFLCIRDVLAYHTE